MNDINKLTSKAQASAIKAISFISKHRTVIVIFIACVAVLAAVFQAQSYLNPVRNEDKYVEIQSSVNSKKIDQDIVDKLSKTQEDFDSSVDSNFVPDRNNPFAE